MRRRRAALCASGAGLVLLALAAAAGAAAGPARPVQFIEQAPLLDGGARVIDGVWKRILPANRAEVVVPLGTWPPQPRLRVSLGLFAPKPPQTPPARARFTMLLQSSEGTRRELVTRELSRTGWEDVEVDLAGRELDGASLVFRKEVPPEDAKRLVFALFANPMLLPADPSPATSVVLISLDTLRADRLGIGGHAGARSPTLDALAREHTWYAQSYSASGWTYPSHAALLYGRYPANVPPVRLAMQPRRRAPQRPVPLPELFRDAGYLTAAFTGGGYMSDSYGFTTGFDTFYMFPQPPFASDQHCTEERFDGALVFGKARQWLRTSAGNPFFLFVHTYDVHDRCPVRPKNFGPFTVWPEPGPKRRARIDAYYDELVARVDALVAGLFDELKALHLLDHTVVLITSDHGEAFWEHGVYGHGQGLRPYEPLTRVPLIVRAPGRPPQGRIEQPVSAVDVAPTLLALAGLPPADGMDGRPLPGLGFDSRAADAPLFVHCEGELAVRAGRYKLLTDRAGESPALYDLEADPGERTNLLASKPEVAAALQRHAAAYWQRVTPATAATAPATAPAGATAPAAATPASDAQPADAEIDEATRERLRALGYIE